ncbi:hypothetical protein BN977_01469 [Mycolicibacterium cosmeticum]|uniref:Uncharacterized protein n=1 Tax=Mycolicibacterium cosmeticum TaxID=258533 RepID=W9AVR3_MYCCO|nr:hypothetical protein BN977_01469 [Mycolicibacterium cosmeticum]
MAVRLLNRGSDHLVANILTGLMEFRQNYDL